MRGKGEVERRAGLKDNWGGGGGGGGPFYCASYEEAEGSSPGFSNFRPEKYSLQGANFRYCSEKFFPALAFLLQNEDKNKIKY